MKLFKAKKEECEKQVAELIEELLTEKIKEKSKVVFAIPGGRSVSGIFELLKKKNIDWKKAHVFMVDERYVPLDHEESNFKLGYETFLKGLIPEENLHPYKIEKSLEKYAEELKNVGGVFDVVLLSSGEDGHVAGVYPEHHSIENEEEGFIYMDDSPKPPSERVTASKKLIKKSAHAILLFFGEGKKEALKNYLDENKTEFESPNKIVNECENKYVFTDI